jgi:iron complex transport system permease protein
MEDFRRQQLNKKETKKRILHRLQVHSTKASILFISLVFLLFITMGISFVFGSAEVEWSTIYQAFTAFDATDTGHLIIRDLRMPRIIGAMVVGAFLAVSGVIMQALTQNPLASPSIMGVSAGSAFMVAIVFAFFPQTGHLGIMGWSFIGAGLAVGLVLLVGKLAKRGLTPVKLALAGAAVTALLQSLSTIIALQFNVAREISFWYAGGVSGVRWTSVQIGLILFILGMIVALLLAQPLTVMSLGEEVAQGLGQRTGLIKLVGMGVVLILTGAAVSIAGTIGFIGLVIPHIIKRLIGVDYRWVIPCSAVAGAWLLVFSDIVARTIHAPYEVPVGAVTALIGVPFFLFLARREGRAWS